MVMSCINATLCKRFHQSMQMNKVSSMDTDRNEEIWIKHYCSSHKILLIGEGDFSFSTCIARAFGSAHNIVAASLDSPDVVLNKYREAGSNLMELKRYGAAISFGVDANTMLVHNDLMFRKFDRIIFNFPHAGFKGSESSPQMINLHRQLVYGFFKNARYMLRPNGEVHVTHKATGPYCKWNLEELANLSSLVLVKYADFDIKDYPGYTNKRGDGSRCDKSFPLGQCGTFMFGTSTRF